MSRTSGWTLVLVPWLLLACGGEEGGRGVDPAREGGLRLELPGAPPVGSPFPIVVRSTDGRAVSGAGEVTVGDGPAQPVTLYQGRGSVSATVGAEGTIVVRAAVVGRRGERTVAVARRSLRRLTGVLQGPDLRWDPGADVVLEGLVQVPAGEKLTIEAGTRVLGANRANLDVAGEIEARGDREAPILFTREGAEPWGQIKLLEGARGRLEHVYLTQAGGDETRQFKPDHSMSQAVVLADAAVELLVEGGGAIDNPGKCYSSRASRVILRDVLVSRCDQGGEHDATELLIEGSHYLEIPDADARFEDDDNDGLHLGLDPARAPPMMIIRDSVFAVCEDDGIDHAGPPLLIQRVRVEGMRHEGIATSAGSTVVIEDSVVLRSENGIEAGWGMPNTVVRNTLLVDNVVGLRFGDEYRPPMTSRGTLTASYVAVSGSRQANVLNWYTGGGYAVPGAIAVSCSMVDTAEWDGQGGNLAGVAPFDAETGCVAGGAQTLPGCPDGPIGPRCR
jgi:hypothetical protein